MTGAATATVETLTAEVRVLMVGNRQITLSVARQLDTVSLEDLTVFGRVKLGSGFSDDLVIGANPDGVLALANYRFHQKAHNWRAWLEVDDNLEPPVVGPDVQRGGGEDHDCYAVAIATIPCLIFHRACATSVDAHTAWIKAHLTWVSARNAWWQAHGTNDGFATPEPQRPDGNFWNPGPHREWFTEQAREQLAEANRRHELYEAAKNAPLIVLAGLR